MCGTAPLTCRSCWMEAHAHRNDLIDPIDCGVRQRIVAQMHEILQSKNAKITKLEVVINELQNACTNVLEEELEGLHRHRKRLEVKLVLAAKVLRQSITISVCSCGLNSGGNGVH